MARSRESRAHKKGPRRYLLYAIPLIALAVISAVFVVYLLPVPDSPAKMDFTFQLLIQLPSKTNPGSVQAYAPARPVGETGGFWVSNQFDKYGVNSNHYPIYMDNPTTPSGTGGACSSGVCTIHVKSTTVYNYTLADYFNVWGMTLGPNNTIGQPSQGTFVWQMCLGSTQPSTESTAWGALPLTSGLAVTLNYYDSSGGTAYCGPA